MFVFPTLQMNTTANLYGRQACIQAHTIKSLLSENYPKNSRRQRIFQHLRVKN